MPHTRRSLTHKFDIQGHEGYINVGFYPDGRPGELFITMAKEGSTIGGLMDVLGTAISIGLQYGVPLEVFVNKFAHSRFEPAGFTKNPDIPIAKSIADYIFRWLGMEFIPGYREANAPRRPTADEREPIGHARRWSRSMATATATIADLEHAEAVMVATGHDPARPPDLRHPSRLARQPERAGSPVRPFPERCSRLRQLRCADRPLRHMLPLLQLRQQHGMLVKHRQQSLDRERQAREWSPGFCFAPRYPTMGIQRLVTRFSAIVPRSSGSSSRPPGISGTAIELGMWLATVVSSKNVGLGE